MKEAKDILLMLGGAALFIIVVGVLMGTGPFKIAGTEFLTQPSGTAQGDVVTIGDSEVSVRLAKDPKSRAKGLSGTEKLEENEGMLFVFDRPTNAPFWMKDMLIPIDIIWISNGEVIGIEDSVQPPETGVGDSDLKLYAPPGMVDYVLEVNAGFSAENGIVTGSEVDLSGI